MSLGDPFPLNAFYVAYKVFQYTLKKKELR